MPRLLSDTGLRPDDVDLSDDVLRNVIAKWTRDPGVRRLERRLGKLLRRVTAKVLDTESAGPVVIDDAMARGRAGKEIPREDLTSRSLAPGVATGLAVTGAGGDVLFVEATTMPGDPGLTLTGQLGDVMKESGELARSYLRAHAEDYDIENADRRIHVHFPSGAVPKDGPSAGITMTTALVSLMTGRRVRPEVAMTGEITLHGRVLPIGGVKQKLLAAHRAGLTTVIVPEANRDDLDDVPDQVRKELSIHLVSEIGEVLDLALAPSAGDVSAEG